MTYTNESVERLVEAVTRLLISIRPLNLIPISELNELAMTHSELTLETPRMCEYKLMSDLDETDELILSCSEGSVVYLRHWRTFKFCPYCGGEIKTLTIEVPE